MLAKHFKNPDVWDTLPEMDSLGGGAQTGGFFKVPPPLILFKFGNHSDGRFEISSTQDTAAQAPRITGSPGVTVGHQISRPPFPRISE
jgi:hypothetical protein